MIKYQLIGFMLAVIILFVVSEIVTIFVGGTPVPIPDIPRIPETLGAGPKLTYVVMGDSTTIAQGGDYAAGYAIASADHLAKKYQVTFVNEGMSGATIKSVTDNQLSKAAAYRPDVALLAVGANDATHFTSRKSLQTSLEQIISSLKHANPRIKIIVTGSPAMDAVSRFPIGAKQLMGLRTKQVNDAFAPIIKKDGLTLAPIAEKTRSAFLADPTLTASDNFHPNNRGYALWIPVINDAIDSALSSS